MAAGTSMQSRRDFLRTAGQAAATFTFLPRAVLGAAGQPGANGKINIAGIGVGGRGGEDIKEVSGENIVALCDVDARRAAETFERLPNAKRYQDFRKMFDEMADRIDAVVVGTPDHTHAVACMAAMKRGKHVYCEKPLAHTVHEIRELVKAARSSKVVTQVGNQGHSSESIREYCEWIWAGAIGRVKEIHAACDAFPDVYCQIPKLPQLQEKHEIPADLNWDLWLGPAQERPYSPLYVPWNWRGWMPFGTGCLGDWVCHVIDPSFWALDLGAPASIVAEVEDYDPKVHADLYPPGSKVTFEFPARGDRGPITLYWYDGRKRIPRPPDMEEGDNPPGSGAVVIGDKGTITHGSHGAGGVKIIPEAKMREFEPPEPTIPRVGGHQQDWLQAIREARPAGSGFEYGGALTEIGLLGAIAIRLPGQKLQWDAQAARFTNSEEANRFLNPPYRSGWHL